MFVVGRVLDPQGKPVSNATTMFYASLKRPGRGDRLSTMWPAALGQARSDGSGRFRLDAPRISSARHDQVGAVAIAPGYGAGWVELNADSDQPDADIMLRPEQVIQGRLFNRGRKANPWGASRVSGRDHGHDRHRRSAAFDAAETEEASYFLHDQPAEPWAWPGPGRRLPTPTADLRSAVWAEAYGLVSRSMTRGSSQAALNVNIDTEAWIVRTPRT